MKKLFIYAGSFNPFHIGHLNISEKIEKIGGKENLLIAIGLNPSKVSIENIDEINENAKRISISTGRKVEVYSTFLHEFIELKENQGYDVVLVRGLRNGDDLSYENNQLKFITDFKPNLKSMFIMCDKEFEHISSTSLRQLESFRKDSSKKYLI